MKLIKQLSLPILLTFVFVGCSNSDSDLVKITYLDEDEKCIEELRTHRYIQDDEYETKFKDYVNLDGSKKFDKIEHGKYLSYYNCDVLRDSVIYIDGKIKESFQFWENGKLREHFLNDIYQGNGMMCSSIKSKEEYWENGELRQNWEWKNHTVSLGNIDPTGLLSKDCEIKKFQTKGIEFNKTGQLISKIFVDEKTGQRVILNYLSDGTESEYRSQETVNDVSTWN